MPPRFPTTSTPKSRRKESTRREERFRSRAGMAFEDSLILWHQRAMIVEFSHHVDRTMTRGLAVSRYFPTRSRRLSRPRTGTVRVGGPYGGFSRSGDEPILASPLLRSGATSLIRAPHTIHRDLPNSRPSLAQVGHDQGDLVRRVYRVQIVGHRGPLAGSLTSHVALCDGSQRRRHRGRIKNPNP